MRFRLVAGSLALTALACVALGLVATLALRGFLFHQLDQRLRGADARYRATDTDGGAADPSGSRQRSDHDGDNFGNESGQEVGTLAAHLAADSVSTFGIVGRGSLPPLSAHARQELLTLPLGQPVSRDLGSLGDYRLIANTDGDRDGTVVTGLPQRPVSEAMAELLAVEAVCFGVVLVLAGAGSVLVVRLSLRPLTDITGTAGDVLQAPLVGDAPLPHRVDVADPASEVGQLGTAFNLMLDHVEAGFADRAETEEQLRRFVADASHELRTPVASVRAHAESIRRLGDTVPGAVAEAMQRIEAEALRMGVLVDDLLLLARLDAGRPLDDGDVDISRLVIDATSDARATFPGQRWQLDLPEQPVTVRGDAERLHQVLANLLSNAGRYTPDGTMVRVAVALVGPLARVTVHDTGPGIPKPSVPHIFERFYRGDTAAGTGSGLGLAIAAAVVHAHGGDISVTSFPGATAFVVDLPVVATGSMVIDPG